MEITSAKYNQINSENISITLVSNGKTYSVPIDTANTDYQAIQEWVSAGNTIEEAD